MNNKYEVEYTGLKYGIMIFIILEILFLLSYVAFLKKIPDFLSTNGWWFLYLIISVTAISTSLWHLKAYKARVSCMSGMMIGMTFGMVTGLLIGAVLGFTNGFFIGATVGMILGILVGIYTGRCCGIMGVLEGMMAGLMGGTMGAMITVMMRFDHILLFMPIYTLINIIILLGLGYMFYKESIEDNEKVEKTPMDFLTFASINIVVVFLLGALMLFGPKLI